MTVDLVPSTDLVPSLPSRIVTVNAVDIQEGTWAEDRWVRFRLVGDVHVAADSRIVLGDKGGVKLPLPEGRGQVRLPVWTDTTGEWAIEVTKSWAPHPYYIRVPAGSGSIDLSNINPLQEVPMHVREWLLTNASVTATEGSGWGASVSVAGGNAHFDFTFPPGGEAWSKGTLASGTHLDDVQSPGTYRVASTTTISGLPVSTVGSLEVIPQTSSASQVMQRYTTWASPSQTFTRRYSVNSGWSEWVKTEWHAPAVLVAGDDLDTQMTPGTYRVNASSVLNKPVTGLGFLEVVPFPGGGVLQRFTAFNVNSSIWTRSYSSGSWGEWTSMRWSAALIAGVDFDTVTTPSSNNVTFIEHPNQPTGRVGVLTVTQGGTIITQVFEPSTGPRDRFTRRRFSDGTWGPWEQEGTGEVQRPLPMWAPALQNRPAAEIVRTFTKDRLVGFNGSHSFGRLQYTRDSGTTWTDMHQFPASYGWVRQLDNGELLAVVGGSADPRSLWLSEGYTDSDPSAATWTQVLTAHAPHIYFAQAWSVDTYRNIVLVAEYGPKTPEWSGHTVTDPARYVYMSLDHGKTWSTVFDLIDYLETDRGLTSTHGQHLHGVAWDPWWDRIWVTFGDDTNGTVFSDDLGQTWHTADWGPLPSAPGQYQAVGIAPVKDGILLGSDGPPNGVWKIDRASGKHTGPYTITPAWTLPGDTGSLTHLCQAIHRVPTPDGGETLLFGFGTETAAGHTFIVGTRNGTDFSMVWQDPLEIPAGRGIRTIAGPTLAGELIVASNDLRASGWSEWRGASPTY